MICTPARRICTATVRRALYSCASTACMHSRADISVRGRARNTSSSPAGTSPASRRRRTCVRLSRRSRGTGNGERGRGNGEGGMGNLPQRPRARRRGAVRRGARRRSLFRRGRPTSPGRRVSSCLVLPHPAPMRDPLDEAAHGRGRNRQPVLWAPREIHPVAQRLASRAEKFAE